MPQKVVKSQAGVRRVMGDLVAADEVQELGCEREVPAMSA